VKLVSLLRSLPNCPCKNHLLLFFCKSLDEMDLKSITNEYEGELFGYPT
jgi:hypothetical protein